MTDPELMTTRAKQIFADVETDNPDTGYPTGLVLAKPGIKKIKPHMVGMEGQSAPPATLLLNSNESAYGPSHHAVAAARAASSTLERYVENVDLTLVPAIAARFALPGDRITTGQGSDDLLARLARGYIGPGDELIRSANGYLKVPNYVYANDGFVVNVADDNFVPSVNRIIAAITERTKIVYLANPENPAGTYLSGSEVRRLHAAMPRTALLVLDAAYEEYVDAPDYEPAQVLTLEADNVVMCRTFSKIYGLAGARVGWLLGPNYVVDTVKRLALTFPIANPSVAAALAALEDQAHTKFVFAQNLASRNWLSDELACLGLNVIPSQTNFVLVELPDADRSAEKLDHALRQQGIALRQMASPAYKKYIRITLGFQQDLERLLGQIERFLKGEI